MTLKTKLIIFFFGTFLLFELFQYLIVHYLIVQAGSPLLIITFVFVTSLLFAFVMLLFIESKVLTKYYYVDRRLASYINSRSDPGKPSGGGKGNISMFAASIDSVLGDLGKSEEGMERCREILKAAYKIASVGSWDVDLNNGKVRCSNEMYRIIGADVINPGSEYAYVANMIHPLDRKPVKEALKSALKENGICSVDYNAILPGGAQRNLRLEGDVKYFADKDRYRINGTLTDSNRQDAFDRIQTINRDHQFYLMELNPKPVLVVDENLAVQAMNEAFQNLVGYSAKDVLGTAQPYPWWPADMQEKYARELLRDVANGRSRSYQRLFRKRNGRNVRVEVFFRPKVKIADGYYSYFHMTDITRQIEMEKNMQFYRAEMTNAYEAERKRLAGELHDEIIQSLASFSLEIDALGRAKEKPSEEFPVLLEKLRKSVQDMAGKLRWLSHELHPSVIEQGLIPALENLAQEVSKEAKAEVKVVTSGDEGELPAEVELGLYRIVQEAMRNMTKHSGATEATIKLRYTASKVRLIISDNGIGFEVPETPADFAGMHKLGVIGMQERCNFLNGKFSLKSHPGKGTVITVEVERNGR